MTNKTLMIIAVVSVIAIAFSTVNSYLLFTLPEESNDELDTIVNQINDIESKQVALNTQLSEILDNGDSEDDTNQDFLSEINILENKIINQSEALARNITLVKDALQENNVETQSDINELIASIASITITLNELNDSIEILSENILEFDQILETNAGLTPSAVYELASKSVVVIRTNLGQGSGFMFSLTSDNITDLIVTNYHVVQGASQINVEFYDRSRSDAVIIGLDAYSDVAVIRVSNVPPEAIPLRLGNSSNLFIGQQLIAIGNPLGLTASLSSGFVSQLNMQIDLEDVPILVPVIQIDLTIAPGSSGGPLLDLTGNVVGITNAGTNAGFNFAVPSNIVNRVVPFLISQGQYNHAIFGFWALEINPETIIGLNIVNLEFTQTGLMIVDVSPGSSAETAGLTPGIEGFDENGDPEYIAIDIIIEIDGNQIFDWADWTSYVSENVSPNQVVSLTLWRSDQIISITVIPSIREQFE